MLHLLLDGRQKLDGASSCAHDGYTLSFEIDVRVPSCCVQKWPRKAVQMSDSRVLNVVQDAGSIEQDLTLQITVATNLDIPRVSGFIPRGILNLTPEGNEPFDTIVEYHCLEIRLDLR